MKILDLDELVELAETLEIPEKTIRQHVGQIERSMGELAKLCAQKMDVRHAETSHQPSFGGLCSSFGAKQAGQECPKVLLKFDADGEFEAPPEEEESVKV